MNAIRNNLISIILCGFFNIIFGMDNSSDVFPFETLPADLKREIIFINLKNEINDLANDMEEYERLELIANRIKDFAQVNKSLDAAINNKNFFFRLIKNLSLKLNQFDEVVAVMLDMSGAQECIDLQNELNALISGEDFSFEEFERLCNKGADLNWTNLEGETPLMHAALNDQLDAVKALISKKANANYVIPDAGITVFDMTINKNIEDDKIPVVIEIINILLQAGANPKKSLVLKELLDSCNQPSVVILIKEKLNELL